MVTRVKGRPTVWFRSHFFCKLCFAVNRQQARRAQLGIAYFFLSKARASVNQYCRVHLILFVSSLCSAVITRLSLLLVTGVPPPMLRTASRACASFQLHHLQWGLSRPVFASPDLPHIGAVRYRHFSTRGSGEAVSEKDRQVQSHYEGASAVFYRTVMGGGDNSIHYGLFIGDAAGDESKVRNASRNTVDFVARLMEVAACGGITSGSKVLELGSATGNTAQRLIQRFGCHVTGLNICPEQNKTAETAARELGFAEKFTAVAGSFDEGWPEEWAEEFDVVLSIDSLVHSTDKCKLMRQAARVLRPGGVLTFSDVLSTETASAEQQAAMRRVLPGLTFARPSEYIDSLSAAGLSLTAYVDFSDHLALTYAGMVHQIDRHRAEMAAAGVPDKYMDDYRASLEERLIQMSAGTYGVGWGAFSAQKRTATNSRVGPALMATLQK